MKQLCTALLLLGLARASFGQLSGPLSGTLGPGEFHVVDTIYVNSTDSLQLMPATTFNFDGPYPFKIYGILLAQGTESDSITFTTDTTANPDRWRGLRFSGSGSSGSRLGYCLIENGLATEAWPNNCGGGVYCYNSSPTFTHCTISDNSAGEDGGGVYCGGSSLATFDNCTIDGNSADHFGGGGCCWQCSPTFTHCHITNNTTQSAGAGVYCGESSTSFTDCIIASNSAEFVGGGVYCEASSIILTDCTVSSNLAERGAGIHCHLSSPSFTNCTIIDNSATNGGGICCEHSSPNLTDCVIRSNTSIASGGGVECIDSAPVFIQCTISGNSSSRGGGVVCLASLPSFMSCTISANSAEYDDGGGVYGGCCGIFTDCTIRDNSAAVDGGGVYGGGSLTNCTIRDNLAGRNGGGMCEAVALWNCVLSGNSATCGAGVYCHCTSPTLTNCTIVDNSCGWYGGGVYCRRTSAMFNSTIVAFSDGEGVYFNESDSSHFQYCDIFGNSGGDIAFFNNDPAQGPTGIGDILATNANGDSCDTYFNIFLDPMFVDTAAGDYHLLAGSPCIHAGDPDLPLDPDSTIADIGAFYFHQLDADEPVAVLPTAYALHPNWPNPFNPVTTIRYDVKETSQVRLTIFNLLGQEVVRLVDGRHLADSYTVSWNAAGLPSGIYLCRMEAPGFAHTRKVVLVK